MHPGEVSEDHPRGYVHADEYYQTYAKGDPIVENVRKSPGYTTIDGSMASIAGHSSSERAMVTPASPSALLAETSSGAICSTPRLCTVPSVPTTANQIEVISQFLHVVGCPPSKATGGSGAMRDSLTNRLVGGHTLPSNP